MNNNILRSGFLTALAVVLALGFTAISQPANAGRNFCPTTVCPANLVGWTNQGTCLNYHEEDCIEECCVWQNNSTGIYCTDLNTCAFQ